MTTEYVFSSRWRVAAPVQAVYDALRDVESYPQWWPQIVAARRLDAASGELRCRSLLPYDLVFAVHREVEDAASGVLRAQLSGDLAGTSQWTVQPDGTGTVAVFDENVEVHKRLVRAAGRFVRPALRFNHDLMMRGGEKGLRRHLDGS